MASTSLSPKCNTSHFINAAAMCINLILNESFLNSVISYTTDKSFLLLLCMRNNITLIHWLGLIPGLVKPPQYRQRLATAATFLCSPGAKLRRWASVAYAREGGRESRIAEKIKLFLILKQTYFSSCGAGQNCYHVFFCSVQLSNLTSRSFCYNASNAICSNTGSLTFLMCFA